MGPESRPTETTEPPAPSPGVTGPASRHETCNGFVFGHDKFWAGGRWVCTWAFRPLAEPWWQEFHRPGKLHTRKSDVLAFLANAGVARAHWLAALRRAADVPTAELALAQAQTFAAAAQHPEWDPGGRTNNPARVERDLQRARGIAEEIRQASARLGAARALKAQLEALGHAAAS